MHYAIKTIFFKLLLCFLSNGMLFATEPEKMEFPLIDKRFEELYNELKQEEDELLEKFKKQYPNVPQDVWQRYYELPQKAFAAIKKEYAGTPTCNGLPKNINTTWSKEQFGTFLEQYTQCAAERNDLDPAKIYTIHLVSGKTFADGDKKSLFSLTIDNDQLYDAIVQGKVNDGTLYWDVLAHFVKIRFYAYQAEYLLKEILILHKDISPECREAYIELKSLINEHCTIIAAMQEEKVLNAVLYSAQNPENKNSQIWQKYMIYLLKIKQIMQW